MQAVVTGLFEYPIKSCAGYEAEEVAIDRYGLSQDRRRMIVDKTGVFLTQREFPRMATIAAQVEENALMLSAPGQTPLRLTLDEARQEAVPVQIWKDTCEAWDEGEDAAAWLSSYLQTSCRLVRMTEPFVRPVDARYGQTGDEVSFADGFPLLLISEESLDDLNARLKQPVPMNRFRPNVVVKGAGVPFAEDGWRVLRVKRSGDTFRIVKPCARCAIPTIDQQTGRKTGKEPLATLSAYRKQDNEIFFGQNVIHDWKGELLRLRVGDELKVVKAGVSLPLL